MEAPVGGGALTLHGTRVFDKELANRHAEPLLLAHLAIQTLKSLPEPPSLQTCAASDAPEGTLSQAVDRFVVLSGAAQQAGSTIAGAGGGVWGIRHLHLDALLSLLAVQAALLPCFGCTSASEAVDAACKFGAAARSCLALHPLHPVVARTLLATAKHLRSAAAGHTEGAAVHHVESDLDGIVLRLQAAVASVEGSMPAAMLFLVQ